MSCLRSTGGAGVPAPFLTGRQVWWLLTLRPRAPDEEAGWTRLPWFWVTGNRLWRPRCRSTTTGWRSRRTDMSTIEESVEVQVPVATAYNQWTQFETFPQFMEGVESIEQLDDRHVHWVAKIGGVRREWD